MYNYHLMFGKYSLPNIFHFSILLMNLVSGLSKQTKNVVIPPLLCWGIAHPLLEKQLKIAEDLAEITRLKNKFQWQIDLPFRDFLSENNSIIITDLDKQIIWVSRNFIALTGYSSQEVIGEKPTMLQGEKTKEKSKAEIREKLVNFESLRAKVVNYRKGGETYNCNIEIYAIQNLKGVFTHFIAIEKEIC